MTQSDKIEGRNPVLEALRADREIDKILVAKGAAQGSIQKIIAMAKDKKIPVQYVEKQKIDQLSTSHAHQGIIAFVAAYRYVEVEDILQYAINKEEDPFILILDEITDPHNLGSMIRTADAAGVHGVIIPKRRAVGLTSVVAKTSAGALEYVPVAKVSNIAQTIEYLKEKGVWIIGADMTGETSYYNRDLTGKIALIIGSEGKGIGRLIKEKCDFLVNIPMRGEVSSLNASVAASILMYEVVKQRESRE
ncbi:23S rRNA (guanosine(2251)-2'-O)-methyltransferase RlmB [Clostridiaceae bacterium 35-E11]